MDIQITYFPPKEGDKGLGSGYVTSGVLKTRFNVLKSAKTANGIFVTLPSNKKEDGTYEDIVSVPNKEARVELDEAILQKMANAGITVDGATQPAATTAKPAAQTQAPKAVTKAPAGAGIPKKLPF